MFETIIIGFLTMSIIPLFVWIRRVGTRREF